jgi:hypothetical protein
MASVDWIETARQERASCPLSPDGYVVVAALIAVAQELRALTLMLAGHTLHDIDASEEASARLHPGTSPHHGAPGEFEDGEG